MRVIGIDPGLKLTGYACVEVDDVAPHAEPGLVEAGVFRLKPRATMASRLAQLHADLCEVLDELAPQLMAVEQLYSHYRHVRTSILMGHARGVVLLAGQDRAVGITELAATEVKRALTGNGHASKRQVQLTVMSQCGLREPPEPPDVADAIAIALCAARRLAAHDPAQALPVREESGPGEPDAAGRHTLRGMRTRP